MILVVHLGLPISPYDPPPPVPTGALIAFGVGVLIGVLGWVVSVWVEDPED